MENKFKVVISLSLGLIYIVLLSLVLMVSARIDRLERRLLLPPDKIETEVFNE